MKQITSNQKFWYYKIIFSSQAPMLKLSFMSAKDRANLYIFTALFTLYHDAVYCIESAMFLSSEKQKPFGSFVNKG